MPRQRQQSPKPDLVQTNHLSDIVKPTIFFGNLDEDIDSWIKNFNRIARANQWNLERKLYTMPAFLRDRAAEYYESLDDHVKSSFERLCDALRDRFLPKELQSLYFSNLFQARQGTVQSIDDYTSGITKLSAKAYGDMDRDQKDGLIREHFVQGLRPEIKRFVMLSNPKTFEEAFRNAKREEANNRLVNTNVENPKAACALNVSIEDCIKDLTGQVQALAMKVDNMSTKGHVPHTRGRPFRGRGRGQFQHNVGRNLRTTDGQPFCNYCKKVGHIEMGCREKKARQGN